MILLILHIRCIASSLHRPTTRVTGNAQQGLETRSSLPMLSLPAPACQIDSVESDPCTSLVSPVTLLRSTSWLTHASNAQNLGLLRCTCVCAETRDRDGRWDEHGRPTRKARVAEMGDAVRRGGVDRRTQRGHDGPPSRRDARHGGCGRLGFRGELGCGRIQVR
jgi:hypothetical protein